MFNLQSEYKPAGDQGKAIKQIVEGFNQGDKKITLLGATGTGKTFTMANIIKEFNRPTLILSHNKTLAAQLATEFKYFFPKNAVHYFVSYFDYYQPEAYVAAKDSYIEADSAINKEIEMFRLGTMASLLTRPDAIVVSSVSALYGLGSRDVFENAMLQFEVGKSYDFKEIKKKLIYMQYKPVQSKIEAGMFEFRGEMLDIFSSLENVIYRLYFNEDELEFIQTKDATSFKDLGNLSKAFIWPSTQFLQDIEDLDNILLTIKKELDKRVKEFKDAGKELEANRLEKKTMYDLRMIKETGFCKGMENYSLYFDKRVPGDPPETLFSYFPDDLLVIIDESHMSLPQFRAMPEGDKSRKSSLVEHGFRLPSALDHRPMKFNEMEYTLGWIGDKPDSDKVKQKSGAKTLFVSATPGEYELSNSDQIVEQIIRPTGLLDPITYVYPKSGEYELLDDSLERLLKKKPFLNEYLDEYKEDVSLKDFFYGEKDKK